MICVPSIGICRNRLWSRASHRPRGHPKMARANGDIGSYGLADGDLLTDQLQPDLVLLRGVRNRFEHAGTIVATAGLVIFGSS